MTSRRPENMGPMALGDVDTMARRCVGHFFRRWHRPTAGPAMNQWGSDDHALFVDVRDRNSRFARAARPSACRTTLADGRSVRSGVPSGTSTGSREAAELRDHERPLRRPGGAAGGRTRQRADRRRVHWPALRAELDHVTISACGNLRRHGRQNRGWAPTRSWVCRWRPRGHSHWTLDNRCGGG